MNTSSKELNEFQTDLMAMKVILAELERLTVKSRKVDSHKIKIWSFN